MTISTVALAWLGNIAASITTTSTPRNTTAPLIAKFLMLPIKPDPDVSPDSSDKFKKTKPNITTPSKIRSTMIVASEADMATSSRRLSTPARSTSPARAGKILLPAYPMQTTGNNLRVEIDFTGFNKYRHRQERTHTPRK